MPLSDMLKNYFLQYEQMNIIEQESHIAFYSGPSLGEVKTSRWDMFQIEIALSGVWSQTWLNPCRPTWVVSMNLLKV